MAATANSPADVRPKADKAIASRHGVLLKALGRPPLAVLAGSTAEIAPVAAFARGRKFFVAMEVPGVDKAKIQVEVAPRLVVIRIDKTAPRSPALFGERRFGIREREVALPYNADQARAKASYTDGVLTVEMPLTSVPPGRTSVIVS